MKDSHRANTLLVELLIVILFFMLAATTIVELFASARQKSKTATIRTDSIMVVQNIADELYLSDDPESVLKEHKFVPSEDGWTADREDYHILVTNDEEKTAGGTFRRMEINVTADGKVLFTLPCNKYTAEEATP